MTDQSGTGHGGGSRPAGRSRGGGPDPWTSELWGRPDTVGGYARPSAVPPQGPPPPPPPAKRPARRGLGIAALVLVALLASGAALAGTLRSSGNTSAAPPKPSATVAPTVPKVPTPSTTPSVPDPNGLAPAPPGTVPGAPPNGGQQQHTPTPQQHGTLTPQQSAAAAAVSKGLVDINTNIGYDGARGAGTGMVLSADGLVLTNHHVIAGATAIRVTDVGNTQSYEATVVGYDSTHDVAVLRLKGASGLTLAPFGSSSSVRVGDAVIAVGNAGGVGGTPSAVAGTVRALDRPITVQDETDGSRNRLTGLIQFDASVQPGDSGGALVDAAGTVAGMVTAEGRAAASSDVSVTTEGFAIPIDQARSIGRVIIDGKQSDTVHIGATGFLGVQLVPGGQRPTSTATRVASVVAGSPAEQAGIEPGGVITSVGGRTVTSAAELKAAVSSHRPGDAVRVAWTDQAGHEHIASIRLATGPVG